MKKLSIIILIFSLLIGGCSKDEVISNRQVKSLTTPKTTEIPSALPKNDDNWQVYGIVYLDNNDYIYIGTPYDLRYASGHPIKIFSEDKINRIEQTGSTSFYVQFETASVEVFIEEFHESTEEFKFIYQVKSHFDEYNMNFFDSFSMQKLKKDVEFENEVQWWKTIVAVLVPIIIDSITSENCADQAIRACGPGNVDSVTSSFGKCSFTCK